MKSIIIFRRRLHEFEGSQKQRAGVFPTVPRRIVHVQTATKVDRHPAAGAKDLDLPIMMQRVFVELPGNATNRFRQRSERVGLGGRRAEGRLCAIAGFPWRICFFI